MLAPQIWYAGSILCMGSLHIKAKTPVGAVFELLNDWTWNMPQDTLIFSADFCKRLWLQLEFDGYEGLVCTRWISLSEGPKTLRSCWGHWKKRHPLITQLQKCIFHQMFWNTNLKSPYKMLNKIETFYQASNNAALICMFHYSAWRVRLRLMRNSNMEKLNAWEWTQSVWTNSVI